MSEAQAAVVPNDWCPMCKFKLHVLAEDAHCRYCGTQLQSSSTASCECGRTLGKIDSFCPRCGRKVKE